MTSIPEFLESLSEKLQQSASVKTIYGEPFEVGEKTIVPVASIAYGLGGGYGKKKTFDKDGNREETPAGQSGGGGIRVAPLGIIEITGEQTRFIPFRMRKTMAFLIPLAAFALGVLCGKVLF
jgi:Uncharacterized conserved protein